MRIELSRLNAMMMGNTHSLKFRDDRSNHCLLSMPLTSITFPFGVTTESNSLVLITRIFCEDSTSITIRNTMLTQELFSVAIKAGFKQIGAYQQGDYQLVPPSPSKGSPSSVCSPNLTMKVHQIRIEPFSLNTLTMDNTHTVNFYEDNSEYHFLSIPLTKITFPFNPEIESNSLSLMANIQQECSLSTSILDSTLTQKLYGAAIRAGFKQDKATRQEFNFHDSLCLVAPFPSKSSEVHADEERMNLQGDSI